LLFCFMLLPSLTGVAALHRRRLKKAFDAERINRPAGAAAGNSKAPRRSLIAAAASFYFARSV
jgi:hypothetical protein